MIRSILQKFAKPVSSTVDEADVVDWPSFVQTQFRQGERTIDVATADSALMSHLLKRTIAQWRAFGDADPLWSNDPVDDLKGNVRDADAVAEFYRIGELGMELLFAGFEGRNGISLRGGTCMDFGAGVGRKTVALAKRFDRVIAVDIAEQGLAYCAERMQAFGIDNVECVVLRSPDDLARCDEIDLFFSDRVLQHNPPPVQRLLLHEAMAKIRPAGHALFQTPDWLPDYSFSLDEYLSETGRTIDMHCFPKPAVLALLAQCRMTVLDFAPEYIAPSFASYTYLARKAEIGTESSGPTRPA